MAANGVHNGAPANVEHDGERTAAPRREIGSPAGTPNARAATEQRDDGREAPQPQGPRDDALDAPQRDPGRDAPQAKPHDDDSLEERRAEQPEDGLQAPYPGLRPFEFAESEVFFGREAHTDRLLEILQREQFLAVIGPSGSGKSSLVRAGLLPALSMGCLGTGSDWRIALLRPGARPLRNLAKALLTPGALGCELLGGSAASAADEALVEADLRRGPLGLIEVAAQARSVTPGFNLLVLVDQFEELFTYAGAEHGPASADNEAFVELLLAQRGRPGDRIHVALTMRTDFLGNCTRFLDLPDAINHAQYLTPRLTHNQLEAAIQGPARVFGGDVEHTLTTELANAVAQTPDELPVLQHALARMWCDAVERDPEHPLIDAGSAQAVGGVMGALSQHAEEILGRLSAPQQRAAEALFRAITDTRVGASGGQQVRRPRTLAGIALWTGLTVAELAPVVAAFAGVQARLLQHGATLGDDSMIDLSHESLIRQWTRLQEWVRSEAERATAYRRWRGRALDYAAERRVWLSGSDLLRAKDWLAPADQSVAWQPSERWAMRYKRADCSDADAAREFALTVRYIEDSQAEVNRRKAERQRAQEQEAQAERDREQAVRASLQAELASQRANAADLAREHAQQTERYARKRAQRLATMAGALSIAAAVSAWFWYQAEQARALAHARQLVAESQVMQSSRPDDSQRAAVQAYHEQPQAVPEVQARLRVAYALSSPLRLTLRGHVGPVIGAAFSPDEKSLLTYSDDGTARLWNAATGAMRALLQGEVQGEQAPIIAAAFRPSDNSVVMASALGPVKIWSVSDGSTKVPTTGQSRPAGFAAFSPDRLAVVSSAYQDRARIWSLRDGQSDAVLQVDGANGNPSGTADADDAAEHQVLVAAAYSPTDATTLATVTDKGGTQVWDTRNGRLRLVLQKPVHDATLNAAPTPEAQRVLAGRRALTVAFSPDGTRILTGHRDGDVKLWNALNGELLDTLEQHHEAVLKVAYSANGRTFATTSADNTACLWRAGASRPYAVLKGHTGAVLNAVFSSAGQVITTSDDKTARVWSVDSGKPFALLAGHSGRVLSAAFSKDGNTVVTTGDDTTARVWDLQPQTPLAATPPRHASMNFALAFSRDGRSIATAQSDHAAVVWDVRTGTINATQQEAHTKPILSAAFSPDGQMVATASEDGSVRVWSARDGHTVLNLAPSPKGVNRVVFSRDGTVLATAGRDMRARLWDAATGRALRTLRGHDDDVLSVAFSADDRLLVTTSSDKTAQLWRVADGMPIGPRLTHRGPVISASFSPSGGLLATTSEDNTISLWNSANGALVGTLRGHTGAVYQAAFDRQGTRLVSASFDGSARLWSVPERKQLAQLRGHSAPVLNAAFVDHDTFILTGSIDGSARIWNVDDLQPIAVTPVEGGPLRSAAYSNDARAIVTSAQDGAARVWACAACAPAEELVSQIEKRLAAAP